MLHVALANIRTYARRYIAVVLAVAIGTAFLAATLAVNSSTRATLKNSLGDSYKNADLVAFVDWELQRESSDEPSSLTQDQVQQVRQLPSVSTAYGVAFSYGELRTADNGYNVFVQPVDPDQELGGFELVEGRPPVNSNELMLDDEHAQKMGVSVGDTVSLNDESGDAHNMMVVGLQNTSTNPQLSSDAVIGMVEKQWLSMFAGSNDFNSIVVNAKDSVPAAQQELQEFFQGQKMNDMAVLTADQKVIADVAQMTGGTDELTVVLLVFALIALVVTGLVVVNTFSVVIAQRTRELALLRTLGAKRNQIRSSVLLEALVIGIIASVLGVLLAVGLMYGLIALLHVLMPSLSYATVAMTPLGLGVPVVIGILMTVIAASLPARRAMKLAPLAALRPFDAASVMNRAGLVRIICGALLTLAGATLLLYGAFEGEILIAFGGGLLSFPGVLMLASLFVPSSVFGIGKLVAGRSVAGRLAALNAVRNPGRTTSTATALLIGVTLVSMIMVGGQTAKASLNNSLAGEYPVDLMVTFYEGGANTNVEQISQDIAQIDGVEATSNFTVATVTDDSYAGPADEDYGFTVMSVDLNTVGQVALDQKILPKDGQIVVAGWQGDSAPKTLKIGGKTLDVVSSSASISYDMVTADTLATLKRSTDEYAATYPGVMVKVDEKLSNSAISDLIDEVTTIAKVDSSAIDGGVVMKATFSQVIDVLLAIVSALLAVAVLIALIGVANTLSLSVLERTRENSLLRALGLKKKQLRSMLAVEAVLIGGVAALLGLILGVIYGLLGAKSTFGAMGEMSYEIPWLQLALVLVISIVAALLASVTPGRRAAKLSPVEGLATE